MVKNTVISKASNLLTIGRVTGPFGIKGWVKVKPYTEVAESLAQYSPWLLKTRHGVKSFGVEDYQVKPQGLLVKLEGIDNRNLAEELGRVDIAIEKSELPDLSDDDYYWHELVGLEVISRFNGEENILGVVSHLMETGSNDVLVVKPSDTSMDDRERLVPYVYDVYVMQVDLEARMICVEWDPQF